MNEMKKATCQLQRKEGVLSESCLRNSKSKGSKVRLAIYEITNILNLLKNAMEMYVRNFEK